MDEILQQNITNVVYIEEFYEEWLQDPKSVPKEWQNFFADWGKQQPPKVEKASQPNIEKIVPVQIDKQSSLPESKQISSRPSDDKDRWFQPTLRLSRSDFETSKDKDISLKQSRVDTLVYGYRDFGYLSASIDPLGQKHDFYYELSHTQFGLLDEDLDSQFKPSTFHGLTGQHKLRDIIKCLQKTYTSTIGVEYMHLQNRTVRRWLQQEMETKFNTPTFNKKQKLQILQDLIKTEGFEHFLHSQFIGQKRFSLEGGEAAIPALEAIIDRAPDWGADELVLGMAHRGRLNVLANIMRKSIAEIFSEFEENFVPEAYGGDGDVKYHKGYSSDRVTGNNRKVHIGLSANPSHLEIIAPVVLGKVRAKQRQRDDRKERKKVLGIVLHGDAAFSGQGVVAETLNLSNLHGYRTGGSIHIIINNQIGFTTSPKDSRSTIFPTDMAKIIQVPIFHVNGDDPEAVVYVAELAVQIRQIFGLDVIIDIVCYRRHGHNEGDEPSFTQPQMYKKIKSHRSTLEIYSQKLIEEGILTKEELQQLKEDHRNSLKEALELAKSTPPEPDLQTLGGVWGPFSGQFSHKTIETKANKDMLLEIIEKIHTIPDDFKAHPKLRRILQDRKRKFDEQGVIDWSLGEAMAFGSLLKEGAHVRLSGQDSGRGTFSQRHAVWWNTEDMKHYLPLNNIDASGDFTVYDSPLSEVSVLGFEYGYSLAEPKSLILWEAQFGDFVNGAQVIIDQFIAAARSKWHRCSGLTVLLPHGYEGQGPEHSSGHLERFLQLCAENNMFVCNVTTPAQYFHLLRRQITADYRMPLVIMTPKSLLRHSQAVSTIDEFSSGHFQEILDDVTEAPQDINRLLFCSGKIYYELCEKREQLQRNNVAIVRLEQIYPFPTDKVKNILKRYSSVQKIFWVQEEPRNRGSWTFINDCFAQIFGTGNLHYIGRKASASPATGSLRQHKQEQEKVVTYAVGE